ncbi:hypothetical protein PVAP13_1NG045916 [Panicum virgatum]|uniref:Uncharacterized protein n=1 Tax=Panicum virgatum TaxID=38727 RepID=A0A8T0WTW5_PANVG|nr:hypothetical protein PVAP13_1NG045916 [Panicum virgatum]
MRLGIECRRRGDQGNRALSIYDVPTVLVHQRSTKCDARGSPRLASSCASVVARDARSWASCYAPHGSTTCTAER